MHAMVVGPVYEFDVAGTPAPQGSKKAILHKHTGRPIVIESSEKRLRPWRDAVRSDAAAARGGQGPLAGPVVVEFVFSSNRPKAHYRTGKNSHLLRDDAPLRPTNKPDLSHLARATEDALTDAGIWLDDAQVVEYRRLAKVYAGEDRDALAAPGVRIRLWALPATGGAW